jgi:hypothetical protein
VKPRDVVSTEDWEFDFVVEVDDDSFVVQDASGRFVCSCDTEDNALSIAGALNHAWMGHTASAEAD